MARCMNDTTNLDWFSLGGIDDQIGTDRPKAQTSRTQVVAPVTEFWSLRREPKGGHKLNHQLPRRFGAFRSHLIPDLEQIAFHKSPKDEPVHDGVATGQPVCPTLR